MAEAERIVEIVNKRGLHARAAAKFVRLAETYTGSITVEKDGQSVCGSSIMGLLMLGAGINSRLTLRAQGQGAEDILTLIADLIERKFDEEM